MASINSLPLELIDLIISRAATSVDWVKFENQLALTARISSNWTAFSEQLLHSHIILYYQVQAQAYLESGSAGKYKTRAFQLQGRIQSNTIRKVMEKMRGLQELTVNRGEAEFDMNILQDDRFSGLTSIVITSELRFNPIDSIPFPFTLRKLQIYSNSTCSPALPVTLLLNSRPTIKSLVINCDQDFREDFKAVLRLEEFTELQHLETDLELMDDLSHFTQLVSLGTTCASWEEGKIEELESILSTLPPSQLTKLELGMFGVTEQITEEELDRIVKIIELYPGLNRLKPLEIGYEGFALDKMQEVVIEWKKRGIEAVFEPSGSTSELEEMLQNLENQ